MTDIVDRLRYSDIYDYADADALCDEAADNLDSLGRYVAANNARAALEDKA